MLKTFQQANSQNQKLLATDHSTGTIGVIPLLQIYQQSQEPEN